MDRSEVHHMNAASVGLNIATRRKELGMTQMELAEKVHVTNKAVSKWENGKIFPDLSLVESIASALDITVTELLGLEEETPEEMLRVATLINDDEKFEFRNKVIAALIWALICFGTIAIGLVFVDNSVQNLMFQDLTFETSYEIGQRTTVLVGVLRTFAVCGCGFYIVAIRYCIKLLKKK